MRELFRSVARPLGTDGELFRGLRVLALDGMLLAVPDSAGNNDAFGKSGSHRSPMGYPQARVVAVAECSSHAVLDAAIGGFKDSERIVSDALDARVGAGTLLLADRGLWGLARWHRLTAERTSFTRALHVVRRSVISPSGFSPSAIKRDRRLGLAEIGRSLLPRRRARSAPRKMRSCITGYGSKAPGEPATSRRPPVVVTLNNR